MKKKILLVHSSLQNSKYAYAGIEKMLTWVGNGLAHSGYDVTFCTIYDSSKSIKISDCANSIELAQPYRESSVQRIFQLFVSDVWKLSSVLKEGYEYVISFGDTPCVLLLLLRLFYRYKLIISERGDPNFKGSFMVQLRRKLYQYFDKVVFQTEGAQNCFNEKVKERSVVIPNPIEAQSLQWKNYTMQKFKIASVGRIDFYQKRQDLLLEAFHKVYSKFPDCELHLYGSGEDEAKLLEMIKQYRIDDSVIFHGAVSNVAESIIDSGVFVLTSDFEGIPNALLEAMALGLPVISTDCSPGGARMLIHNMESGILVPCGDANSLAEAIETVYTHPELAVSMGQKARQRTLLFSPNEIINKWKEILI